MTKDRKAELAAKRRGLPHFDTYVLTCLTCGRKFESENSRRLFGCGCCSSKYNRELREHFKVGMHVLAREYDDPEKFVPGVLKEVMKESAVFQPDDGRRVPWTINSFLLIYPIMDLEVEHFSPCAHNPRGRKKGYVPGDDAEFDEIKEETNVNV